MGTPGRSGRAEPLMTVKPGRILMTNCQSHFIGMPFETGGERKSLNQLNTYKYAKGENWCHHREHLSDHKKVPLFRNNENF